MGRSSGYRPPDRPPARLHLRLRGGSARLREALLRLRHLAPSAWSAARASRGVAATRRVPGSGGPVPSAAAVASGYKPKLLVGADVALEEDRGEVERGGV